jgi:hypothetical protein
MKKLLGIVVLGLLLSFNANATSSYVDDLKKLGEAYKSGLISKEIFESSKKRIINNIKSQSSKITKNSNSQEIEFPSHKISWERGDRKKNWIEMMETSHKYKTWADAISTKSSNTPAYSFGWRTTNDGLVTSAKKSTKTCEKFRKERLYDYNEHDICIVYFLNELPTTDEEKIKFAKKFYGKKKASLAFENNQSLLKKAASKVKITKKKELKKVVKKYELKGERSIALSWEGYEDLIAGTVKFDEVDYKGTLNLPLPNNDGTCSGTYSLQEDEKGTWQIACSNNMSASGNLKWVKDGGVTGTGTDHNNKKVKFTVSKNN